jgi:hypothetical protein
LFQSNLFAQTDISSKDLLGAMGKVQNYEISVDNVIQVDVGSAGANQTWDFRNVTFEPLIGRVEFLDPAQTAFAGEFPEANLAQKINMADEQEIDILNYYQIESQLFIHSGLAGYNSENPLDSSYVQVFDDTVATLPMMYQNTWTTVSADTFGLFPVTASITIDTTVHTIDAWGTVRLPMGDFQCLRLRNDVKSETYTVFNGVKFPLGTETSIDYVWIAKDHFQVAGVESMDGETDPNFSQASYFQRLTTVQTAVSDRNPDNQMPTGFHLLQNYPNPFNSATKITFSVPDAARVTIQVYDLNGRLVATLIDDVMPAGMHSQIFETDNLASGTYVYKMRAGDFTESRKMQYLK